MKKYISIISAIFLTAFGALTFYLSFSLIFDLFNVRHDQENFVPFVAWANLVVSGLYFISAFGFFTNKEWTVKTLLASVGILVVTFGVYNMYLSSGGAHLEKTWGALIFRTSVTIVFTISAYFTVSRSRR